MPEPSTDETAVPGGDEAGSFDLRELTRQALAADPDASIDGDAVPLDLGDRGAGLLPEWYMPVSLRSDGLGSTRRRRAWTVGLVVGSLLLVNGAGLCVTYGFPEIAW